MLLVPVKGDKIKIRDSDELCVVSSYTNLKSDPALYIVGQASDVIYFSNIEEINGIKVEFNSSNKVFDSMGPLRRRINLPQPGDTIKIKEQDESSDYKDSDFVIKSIKLHDRSKKAFGILVNTNLQTYDLSDIVDIERKLSVEKFDLSLFKRYYIDYFPI